MSNCGPISQCKTNRCYCKQNNQLCKQNCPKCKCTNSNCVNRTQYSSTDDEDCPDPFNNLKCNCQKGKCKSNTNCGCIKSNKRCNQKCKCTDCENINSSQSNSDSNSDEECEFKNTKNKSSQNRFASLDKASGLKCKNVNYENTNKNQSGPELIGDLNDLASYISQRIRVPVTNKKDVVFEFRNNIDLYTRISKANVENPQVDHIIEDQIVGHAAAHVLQGKQAFEPYLNVLKESVNLESLDNYNVTFGSINGSKGSILKRYLRDNINKGFPLRALIDPASHFGKNMEPIFQVMNNTHEIVEEYIAEGRRSDGHITGNQKYKEIAEELSVLIKEMKLDVNEERKTRSSNRK